MNTLDPPGEVRISPSNNITAEVGQQVHINCTATSDGEIMDFQWWKNDMRVSDSSTLRFASIQPNNAGRYYCNVTNRYGHETATLNLHGKIV